MKILLRGSTSFAVVHFLSHRGRESGKAITIHPETDSPKNRSPAMVRYFAGSKALVESRASVGRLLKR